MGTTAAVAEAIATGGLSAIVTIIGGAAGAFAAFEAADAIFAKVEKAQKDSTAATAQATAAENKKGDAVSKTTSELSKQIETKSKLDSSYKSEAQKAYESVIAGPVKAYAELGILLANIGKLRENATKGPAEFGQYIAAATALEGIQKQLGLLDKPILSASDRFITLGNQLKYSAVEEIGRAHV